MRSPLIRIDERLKKYLANKKLLETETYSTVIMRLLKIDKDDLMWGSDNKEL